MYINQNFPRWMFFNLSRFSLRSIDEWRNLSVNKRRFPWNEVAKQILFLSEPANFTDSDRLGSMGLKMKRAIRKKHTSFLLFHFWDLESVSIDSALICILHRFLHEHIKLIFLRKCYQGKLPNLKIWVKYFLKCPYLICSHKTWKCWNQNIFYKNLAKNRVDEIVFVKFWF